MRRKIKELYIKRKSSNFFIIILTETWLNSTFLNTEILDSNWIIYRKDRDYRATKTKRGEGVLIAVIHTSIPSNEITVNTEILPSTKIIFAKLNFLSKTIFLCSLYIPPSSNDESYNSIYLTQSFKFLECKTKTTIFLYLATLIDQI